MKKNIIYKLNTTTNETYKITNNFPVKENQQADISMFYAPYGFDPVKVRYNPQKFQSLMNVNPIPSLKLIRETDLEIISSVVPEEHQEANWSLYYLPIGYGVSGILQSFRATQYGISFERIDMDIDTEGYLGEYATASTVTATIDAELKALKPSAVTNDFVNVFKTTTHVHTSWIFDGTDWADFGSIINETVIDNTIETTETFKATTLSNDSFNMGTPEAQAMVLNTIYAELEQLNTLVSAITGDISGLMTIANYDTDGTATDSVKYARNVGVDGASKSATDIIAGKFPTIDLDNGSGEGQITYDSTNRVVNITYGNGVTLQVGEENYIFAVNKHGSDLVSGQPVSLTGATGNTPQFVLATNTDDDLAHKTVGILTEDINNNAKGKITNFGLVRGIDTSAFSEGDFVAVGDGGLVLSSSIVAPTPLVEIGIVLVSNAVTGVIFVDIHKAHKLNYISDVDVSSSVEGDMIRKNASEVWESVNPEEYLMSRDIQNGAFKETFDLRYNATTSLLELTNPSGNTLTQQFSDGDTPLDVTTAVTIAPTFGTTTVPVKNYIYILQSNKGVLVKDTGSWPGTEHIKVAEVTLLDEAYTDTEGPLGNQNHNNHEKGSIDLGALNHIRDRIRSLGANWESGIAGATSGEWVNDVGGTLYWTSTAGTVWQMHLQTYTAKDTSGTDDMHIVNDFTSPYTEIMSFDEITAYSDGTSIGNDYFNVFVYGIINKSGEYTPIMVNTPSAGYNNLPDAQADLDQTLVTTVPTWARRIAFPIARLLLRKVGATYSFIQSYDLREERFGIGGTGGTGVLDGEFIDTTFELQYVSDTSAKAKISAENVPTSTTVTVKWPNANLDLEDVNEKVIRTLPYTEKLHTTVVDKAKFFFYGYDENDSTFKKMSLNQTDGSANTATGSFVASDDYSGDGLGAYKTAMQTVFTAILDTASDFYVDIKTQDNNQVFYVKYPTHTVDTPVRLSTDNTVTYYDVYANGIKVNGLHVSGRELLHYFDGTDMHLLNYTQDTHEESFEGAIVSTKDTLAPLNGGAPQFTQIDGLSPVQSVEGKGDDLSGVNLPTGVTLTTIGGIDYFEVSIASSISAYFDVNGTTNDKFYVQLKYYGDNSNPGNFLIIQLADNTGANIGDTTIAMDNATTTETITSKIITASTGVPARLRFARSAVGGIFYLREIICIPLTNTPLSSKTASQLAQQFPQYIPYGINDAQPEFKFTGLNLFDGELSSGFSLDTNGDLSVNALRTTSTNYANVLGGESYTFSFEETLSGIPFFIICEYDNELSLVARTIAITSNITLNSATRKVRFTLYDGNGIEDYSGVTNFQINEGTTALAYRAYHSPTARKFVTNPRSAGTVYDTITRLNDTVVLNKNVGRDLLNEGNLNNFSTSLTNLDSVDVNKDILSIHYNNTSDLNNLQVEGFTYLAIVSDTTSNEYKVSSSYSNTKYRLFLPKGLYASLAEVVTGLNGTKFVYELSETETEVIDTDGSTYQEEITTIEQQSLYAFDNTIKFAINSQAQAELDRAKIANLQAEIDRLESDATTFKTSVMTFNVLLDTKVDVSAVTSAPANNITLTDDWDNYDALEVWWTEDGTETVDIARIADLDTSAQNEIGGLTSFTTSQEIKKAFKLDLDATTKTEAVAYYGRLITTTYATPTIVSASTSTIDIIKIVGIKYGV